MEEIIRIIRQADAGQTVRAVCREHNVHEVTFHRWKRKYGGLKLDDALRQQLLAQRCLVVQSRREAVWIGFKAFGFFLPARTDELIRSETGQGLETLGKVVGVEERAEVLS
jgi:putative transposase